MTPEEGRRVRVGDVVQIMPEYDPGDGSRMGWVGAFVLVTELKGWGIMGFVHMIETHDEHKSAYIRLKWDVIELIGSARALPVDLERERERDEHESKETADGEEESGG